MRHLAAAQILAGKLEPQQRVSASLAASVTPRTNAPVGVIAVKR